MSGVRINVTNQPLGTYAYLSWLQQGISTAISREDREIILGATPRAKVSVAVNLEQVTSGVAVPFEATAEFELFGSGEVTGCDHRAVIRVSPQPGVSNAESNFFPMAEFDQANLPWQCTPAKPPGATDRLRPWLCLIALADTEFTPGPAVGPTRPLPTIKVNISKLPDLRQSWAWAHVQVSVVKPTDPAVDDQFVAKLLATEPHRVVSRLLCPRQLLPRTAYTAFIVPTFKRGVLRGLGKPVGEDVDGLEMAWGTNQPDPEITLPVYFHWQFQTGEQGDFESLVKLLKPRSMPATVGIRDMDVSNPGLELPRAFSAPLGLEGALMSTSTKSTVWEGAERDAFVKELQEAVNQPADWIKPDESSPAPTRDKTVAPPLYGQFHAASDRLDSEGRPVWFQELNADPRLRVTAGLGTQVVQAEQRQLMAGAWQQADKLREANEALRWGQCAREASASLQQRFLATLDVGTMLLVAMPMLSRVLSPTHLVGGSESFAFFAQAEQPLRQSNQRTLRALFQGSAISTGIFEGELRSLLGIRRPIWKRHGGDLAPRLPELLQLMNTRRFSPGPIPATPDVMTTPKRIGNFLLPNWCTQIKLEEMSKQPRSELRDDLMRRWSIRDGLLAEQDIRESPPRPNFRAIEAEPGTKPPIPQPLPQGRTGFGVDSASARAFRNAAAASFARSAKAPAPTQPLFGLDIDLLHNELMTATNPRIAITASIRSRVGFSPITVWNPLDPLEPIIPAPEFPQPMYASLAKLSQDWVLPGLDQVPPNTISLLATNQRVIEAFMIGLNHEMSRELLFHEFRASQRGTYFRQFWSVAGTIQSSPDDSEKSKDINPINRWNKSNKLGQNSSRPRLPGGGQLVLLIRGELLQRYPNTVISAVKAKVEDGKRKLGGLEEFPVFNGSLKPDVSFFGFNLTAEEVRGKEGDSLRPGWFFVLTEAHGETRFGLDVGKDSDFNATPSTWNDISWKHLAKDDTDLKSIVYIDLTRTLPNEAGIADGAVWHANAIPRGTTAADLAYITLQRPVRIAIHGSDMLPTS